MSPRHQNVPIRCNAPRERVDQRGLADAGFTRQQQQRAAAIAGFALLGLGLAGIFPQIVTVAARLDPEQAGRNIGRIASVSYTGLLSGPVVIGAIASGVGLRNALLVPAALALVVAAAAGVMKPARAGRARTRTLPRSGPAQSGNW